LIDGFVGRGFVGDSGEDERDEGGGVGGGGGGVFGKDGGVVCDACAGTLLAYMSTHIEWCGGAVVPWYCKDLL
jgi:hypothetical protein